MLKSLLNSIFKSAKGTGKDLAVSGRDAATQSHGSGRFGEFNPSNIFTLVNCATPGDTNVILTTVCNLRCEYCLASGKHASQNSLRDMDGKLYEKIRDQLLATHPNKHMILSGGEITFMKNWISLVTDLLERDFQVAMITNLVHPMEDADVEILLRLNQILISVDTPDPSLAKKYRSKTRLEVIVFNIIRIRSLAASRGVAPPPMSFHCTLGSQTIGTLPALVSLAHACGVGHVHVNEVTEHNGLNFEYKPVTSFSHVTREDCISLINETLAQGRRLGVRVSIVSGLTDALQNNDYADVPTGMTRACFDPWGMMLFGERGDIHTCCNGYPPVANVDSANSLNDIFFSAKKQALHGRTADWKSAE